MDCERGLLLINARIDGELLPEDSPSLNAHLAECATCRSTLASSNDDDRELQHCFATRRRKASAVAERVLDVWSVESRQPVWNLGRWRWATAAAAGFALACILFGPDFGTGARDKDVSGRVRLLMTEWAHSDTPYEIELQIRSLGAKAAAPLMTVVQDWQGEPTDDARMNAARVLCDLSDSAHIESLIDLLGDRSFEIQKLAEASLVRITGWRIEESLGPSPPQGMTCSNPQVEWREWWDKNKDLIRALNP